MKYVFVPLTAALPKLKFKLKDASIDYYVAEIKIGQYDYIFTKQLYPPNHWMSDFWPPNLYKKIANSGSKKSNLSSNLDLQGIRLDVGIKGRDTFEQGNDVGDQPHFKLVMDLIFQELCNIAKTGQSLWIVNDLFDSSKRDSIYDRFGRRICTKFGYVMYKFLANESSECYRFLRKEGDGK